MTLIMATTAHRRPVRGILCLLFACVCCLLGGCYTNQPMYPEDYRTVAVPIFENRTFYRNVEFDVTEALIKEIELRTPYKVVDQAIADTLIQGQITTIEQRVVSRRSDIGVVQEIEYQVLANVQWKDLRSGRTIMDRQGLEAIGRYIPTTPVGETPDIAQHAAVERMSRDIVDAMRSDW